MTDYTNYDANESEEYDSEDEYEEYSSVEEGMKYPQEYGSEDQMGDTFDYYVESAKSIGNNVENMLGLYADCKRVEEQTMQVQAWSQAEIIRTAAKYKSCQDFLDKTFGERDKALSKHYDLLDRAVASNDKDLILAALTGISSIVTKSPLDDFEKFVELYNDTSQPLLDF